MSRKMKILGGLVLFVIIAGVAVVFWIDRIAVIAVEKGGTYALGTNTELDSADIGILSASASFSGLHIDNPEELEDVEFDVPYFFAVEEGSLAVSAASLLSSEIVAPKLELRDVGVSLYKRGATSNYGIVLDNVKRLGGDKAPGSGDADKESGKTFVIEEVVIRNITVYADVIPIGGAITKMPPVRIDEIRVENVGRDGGLSMGDLVATVVTAVLEAVSTKVVGLPVDIAEELGSGLVGIADLGINVLGDVTAVAGDVAGEAARRLENAAGEAAEAIGGAAEGVGDAAGDVVDEIGGLLGGSKKKKKKDDDPDQ